MSRPTLYLQRKERLQLIILRALVIASVVLTGGIVLMWVITGIAPWGR